MAVVRKTTTNTKGEFDIVYLTRKDIAITKCHCDQCNGTVSVGSSYNWITFQCKCRTIMFYGYKVSKGEGDVIKISDLNDV